MDRYVIGQDYNTKDWFIYDNETGWNICWCDTEQECIDHIEKLLSNKTE